MEAVDPGEIELWPDDVRECVTRLRDRCRDIPDNSATTPSHELALEHVDAAHEAEVEFLELLDNRCLVLYHATRLLPHEVEAIRRDGLLTLSDARRDARLDIVIQQFGDAIGTDALEELRSSGPLTWGSLQRDARLNVLYGVTPLDHAFAEGGRGMTVFLEHWGGETFYWAAEGSTSISHTIDNLTAISVPTIVEFALPAASLRSYSHMWQVFVGQLGGWESPWHEFRINEDIPPDRIRDLIHEASPRWPRSIQRRSS